MASETLGRTVVLLAALLVLLLGACRTPAIAQTAPAPPIRVVFEGQTLTLDDITAFMSGVYSAYGAKPTVPQIQQIQKEPSAMPSDAPLVSYQGRDPGPPVKEIIWFSNAPLPQSPSAPGYDAKVQELQDQTLVAMTLAAVDAGTAGPKVQKAFANVPNDRASHLALASAFVKAFDAASDQSAAFSASKADWIRSHVDRGMTRADVYKLLKSQGLVAYNFAFVKGKPTPPASPNPKYPSVGGDCNTMDQSSGAWPYQNEPLPKQEGACEVVTRFDKPTRNPDANIVLGGAFNMACGWSTSISISFGDDDRVTNVQVSKPQPTCM